MSLMLGIISYLPNEKGFIVDDAEAVKYLNENKRLREVRKNTHYKQLEWFWNNLPKDIYTMGIYQNWNNEDFDSNIRFPENKVLFKEGLGVSLARNKILEYFYNSDFDWLMMCDDDAWLYDYYNSSIFLAELHVTHKFDELDMILPYQPTVAPFKKINYTEENQKNYIFTRAQLQVGMQVCFISNIRKRAFGSDVYSNDAFYEKYKYGEDALFLHDWVKSGYQVYTLTSLIMRMDTLNNSAILGMKSQELRKLFTRDTKIALSENSDFEFIRKGNREILSSRKILNNTKAKLLIPRELPIVFTPNLIPKGIVNPVVDYTKRIQKLF